MKPYDPKSIEEKWLAEWESQKLFQGTVKSFPSSALSSQPNSKLKTENRQFEANKFYALFAFAYPSGSGLHVGHVESKTALDILVRFQRMQGKDVFFPVGWDAFGLPAENYAIKTGIHPSETTKSAINTFRSQIKRLAISYDWETELATCHPGYYRWTQWIFIQLFKAGLAYRDKSWVNWCPSCKTVLANEQVVNGECERCGSKVVQKELEQWKFRITKYQDELLSGLDQVDWPKATKLQQENWIGKSVGTIAKFPLTSAQSVRLECFTTRLDTIYGVTFLVISPEKFKEFNLIDQVDEKHKGTVLAYLDQAFHKTEEQRRVGEKDKTGVDTHLKVMHPLTNQEIPVWIADYVLAGYGTGVVMGVPAHDARDNAFAVKFGLPIIEVVESSEKLFSGYGALINSGEYSRMESQAAIDKMLQDHPEFFSKETTYRLRDWLISRQRYWGAPIPMVYCETCAAKGQGERVKEQGEDSTMAGWYSVPEDTLPVQLPEVPDFRPTDDGKSPLEKAQESWKYTVCPGCKGKAKREVDTMDTFVDSSWYFLRYASRNNTDVVFDKEVTSHLLPVDLYLIGPEHIVLHLLYARFFTKFFRDQGYLSFDEPFLKMRHQGMILGPDGKKMSKSKGNVISPDLIIEKFGADTLRVYEMFMGPLDADKAWDMSSVAGVYRFLSRVYSLFQTNLDSVKLEAGSGKVDDKKVLIRKLHWMIDKLSNDIPALKFNTSIAALMEFTNVWSDSLIAGNGLTRKELRIVSQLLAPLAPMLAEELWSLLQEEGSVHQSRWSEADPSMLTQDTTQMAVQINGKVKSRISLPTADSLDPAQVEEAVKTDAEVLRMLSGQTPKKVIVIPGKLVNIVV